MADSRLQRLSPRLREHSQQPAPSVDDERRLDTARLPRLNAAVARAAELVDDLVHLADVQRAAAEHAAQRSGPGRGRHQPDTSAGDNAAQQLGPGLSVADLRRLVDEYNRAVDAANAPDVRMPMARSPWSARGRRSTRSSRRSLCPRVLQRGQVYHAGRALERAVRIPRAGARCRSSARYSICSTSRT